MGCFSDLFMGFLDDDDRSYPSPERQSMWRLDDLWDRLCEVIVSGGSGYSRLSPHEIRYTPPERLCAVCDIKTASELTKEELQSRYGIIIRDELEPPEEAEKISRYEQNTFVGCEAANILHDLEIVA